MTTGHISLPHFFTSNAQRAYHVLSAEEAEDYILVKPEILAHCGLFSAQIVAEFHCWCYHSEVEAQMDDLQQITFWWLQPTQLMAKEVLQPVTMDSFLQGLPNVEQKAVGMVAPQHPTEMVLMESLEMGRCSRQETLLKSCPWMH